MWYIFPTYQLDYHLWCWSGLCWSHMQALQHGKHIVMLARFSPKPFPHIFCRHCHNKHADIAISFGLGKATSHYLIQWWNTFQNCICLQHKGQIIVRYRLNHYRVWIQIHNHIFKSTMLHTQISKNETTVMMTYFRKTVGNVTKNVRNYLQLLWLMWSITICIYLVQIYIIYTSLMIPCANMKIYIECIPSHLTRWCNICIIV